MNCNIMQEVVELRTRLYSWCRGFDVYVNMVLEDVTEIEQTADGPQEVHLDQILLNGNNIAVLVPGGKPL
jgi:U6 snRNA-associated Sm-like protein LSm5